MKLKVKSIFEDKYTRVLYKVGDVIEIEDLARVQNLVSRNLADEVKDRNADLCISLFGNDVERKYVKLAMSEVGTPVAQNITDEKLIEKIGELSPEQTEKLKAMLEIQ